MAALANVFFQGAEIEVPSLLGAYYFLTAGAFLVARILWRRRRGGAPPAKQASSPAEDDLWQVFFLGLNPVFGAILFPLFWPFVLVLQTVVRRSPERGPAPNLKENRGTSWGGDAGGPGVRKGAEGRAVCDLRPSGRVEVDGKLWDAVSREGFIPSGHRIRIAGTDGFRLTVVKAR